MKPLLCLVLFASSALAQENLGNYAINDFVNIVATTHSVSTGACTAADSLPLVNIYEDATQTAVASVSMSLLDSANTCVYQARVQLLAATYKNGKNYTAVIAAAVNNVPDRIAKSFSINDVIAIHRGVAAGASSTSITLASGASTVDGTYSRHGTLVVLTGGTGAGQVRTIVGYTGSTKVATVETAWNTPPISGDTQYAIIPR